jgi:hypothetical protein
MHICVVGQDGNIFVEREPTNPWSTFFSQLIELGNTFAINLDCTEIDVLICLGYHPKVLEKKTIKKLSVERKILINWEPQVVEPELYEAKYFSNFGVRLSPSTDWAKKIDGESFFWPQSKLATKPKFENWKSRENVAVIIQANKFSAHKDAKYNLRRKIIWVLGIEKLLVLYGKDWNSNFFLNLRAWLANARRHQIKNATLNIGSLRRPPKGVYLGEVEDKALTYYKYQIALVIENSVDYVSEKYFDAVSAGCVTVYVGDKDNSYFKNLPRDLLPRPSVDEICASIEKIIGLTERKKFALFERQYRNIKRYEPQALNFNVLANLAMICNKEIHQIPPH